MLCVLCAGPKLNYKKDDVNFQLYSMGTNEFQKLTHLVTIKFSDKSFIFSMASKYELIYKLFGMKFFKFISYV